MKRLLSLLGASLVCASIGLPGCASKDKVRPFGDGGAKSPDKSAPIDSGADRGQYMAGSVVGT